MDIPITIKINKVLEKLFHSKKHVVLSGVISNPLGTPLPNQRISLITEDLTIAQSSTTDNSGNYSLKVSPGIYRIQLQPNSSNSVQANVSAEYEIRFPSYPLTQSTVLDIKIPEKKVRVHVHDAAGNPVSGVEINNSYVHQHGLEVEGISNSGNGVSYHYQSISCPKTDTSGSVDLWVFPGRSPYTINAIPPAGSGFSPISKPDVIVTHDMSVTLKFSESPIGYVVKTREDIFTYEKDEVILKKKSDNNGSAPGY